MKRFRFAFSRVIGNLFHSIKKWYFLSGNLPLATPDLDKLNYRLICMSLPAYRCHRPIYDLVYIRYNMIMRLFEVGVTFNTSINDEEMCQVRQFFKRIGEPCPTEIEPNEILIRLKL